MLTVLRCCAFHKLAIHGDEVITATVGSSTRRTGNTGHHRARRMLTWTADGGLSSFY